MADPALTALLETARAAALARNRAAQAFVKALLVLERAKCLAGT